MRPIIRATLEGDTARVAPLVAAVTRRSQARMRAGTPAPRRSAPSAVWSAAAAKRIAARWCFWAWKNRAAPRKPPGSPAAASSLPIPASRSRPYDTGSIRSAAGARYWASQGGHQKLTEIVTSSDRT